MSSLWQRFLSRLASGKRRPRVAPRKPRSPGLYLESLEDRCVPTTFNVNTVLDLSLAAGVNANGTIGATSNVTLRSAIQAANNTPGDNTINLTVAGDYRLLLPASTTNVVGAVITNGGTGYTSAPTVSFTGGGGTGAAGFATLNAAGEVASVTITNGGTGYTSAPILHLSGGGGSGATATALLGEDDNLAGELAILPTGGTLLIQNISGGGATIDGNNAVRDLDINPNFSTSLLRSSVVIAGVTITNGLAAPNDFAAGSGGGVRDQGPVSLTLNNDVITNNFATADGGGVAMENSVSTPWTLSLTSTIVSNNHAGDAGGGIETDGSGHVNINIGSVITGNTTVNQGGGVWLDALNPTGATLVSATLNVTDAVISNNSSGMVDGGIGQAGNSTVTITNSTVENNFTMLDGGGFGDQNNQGTLIVLNSYFLGNTAGNHGGGIQEGGPSTTITNTEIKGNSGGFGGGLFANGAVLTILDCTIADNTAVISGGGLELQLSGARSSIVNTTIAGNRALNNGQAGIGGGINITINLTGVLSLGNDTISGNFADTGGGIYWMVATGAAVQVENTILAQNSASLSAPDAFNNTDQFSDFGGNILGSTNGNTGFTAGTTQVGVNPLLGPLGNNLGPLVGAPGAGIVLETEAITGASPAFDKGVTGLGVPTTDERGFPRADDGANEKPDVGAFEYQDGFAAATFLQNGVWRFNAATGQFQKLGSADAALLAVDQSGDVAAEFSGQGLYLYTQATGAWTRLTTATASALAIDAKGDVFAVLSGAGMSGLYRYDGNFDQLSGATATLLAADAAGDLAAEFPHQGVWRFLASSGSWTQIAQADASLLAIDRAGDVFADLAGMGVWRYTTATGFQQLTPRNASLLAVDALGDLALDFHGTGVWRYTAATGALVQIGAVDPSLLSMDDGGDLFAEFPGGGVYENTLAGGWMQIGVANASVLAAS